MRNGTIRLKWREKGRTRYRYYDPEDFDKFLDKVRTIDCGPVRFHVLWNGLWHSCHTITDVKENLKRMKGGF